MPVRCLLRVRGGDVVCDEDVVFQVEMELELAVGGLHDAETAHTDHDRMWFGAAAAFDFNVYWLEADYCPRHCRMPVHGATAWALQKFICFAV
ncbi:hypothetical protein ACLOJK_029427 [Asimina triloba]